MKHRLASTLALAALLAAGVLASLTLAPAANAYTVDDLLRNGYSTFVVNLGGGCRSWKVSRPPVNAQLGTDLGSDCDPDFQARLDAYITATCPCAQPTTTSTAATTTTPADTTTTTAPPPTDPTTTTAPPPPPPPPAPVTTVDTTAQVIDALTARIVALEQKIAALSTRVDRLELAGDASWLAYQQSIANGDAPDIAAGLARATWLNAVYGLGVFA